MAAIPMLVQLVDQGGGVGENDVLHTGLVWVFKLNAQAVLGRSFLVFVLFHLERQEENFNIQNYLYPDFFLIKRPAGASKVAKLEQCRSVFCSHH